MSYINDTTPITFTVNIGDDEITNILNTTSLDGTGTPSTKIGLERGMFLGWRLVCPYIKVGDEAVTLSFEDLIDGAWTASENPPTGYVGGDNTLAASTTHPGFTWIMRDESNIYVTNGSTGPDDLDFGACYLTPVVHPGDTY